MTTAILPSARKRIDEDEDELYPTRDGEPLGETDLHRQITADLIAVLMAKYQDDPDVYVSGNNFLYYEQGKPEKVVSPDCYVVFGVEMRLRDTFMSWRENNLLPHVVFEITSKKTKKKDTTSKFEIYQSTLNVPEYFLFDPKGDYLRPNLKGYRLVNGLYVPIRHEANRLYSEQLNVYLTQEGNRLRVIDAATGQPLHTPGELARIAAEQTRIAAEQTQRAERAEAEWARLRAEFEAFRQQKPQE